MIESGSLNDKGKSGHEEHKTKVKYEIKGEEFRQKGRGGTYYVPGVQTSPGRFSYARGVEHDGRRSVRAEIELADIGAESVRRMRARAMSARKMSRDALTAHAPRPQID